MGASCLEVVALSQPEDLFNVKVRVLCGCGAVRGFWVPIDRQIPGPLRCSLGRPVATEVSELSDALLATLAESDSPSSAPVC